jgi:hypothetical protein
MGRFQLDGYPVFAFQIRASLACSKLFAANVLYRFLRGSLAVCLCAAACGGVWGATVVKLGNVRQLTGPQDLDLEGNIVYAINFSADDPIRTVRGVQFLPDRQAIAGVTLVGPQLVTAWQTKPELGSTADANQLEEILHDIRWANAGSNERLRATLNVTAGLEYKLQILISGNRVEDRRWDIRVNGQEAVDEITSLGISPGQSYSPARATVYTYQFTPITTNIVVEMGNLFGANDGGDRNALWQALILERVFIPPTPDDIVVEPAVFFSNQTGALSLARAVDGKPDASHLFAFAAGIGDADNAKFTIVGNEIRAAVDLLSYLPGTAFSVRIRATDSADATRFLEKIFTLSIATPHAPAAIRLDVASINALAQVGAKLANVMVADADNFDRHSVALVEGMGSENNSLFTITNNELRAANPLPPGLTEVHIRLRAVDLANQSVESTFVLPVVSPQLIVSELIAGYSPDATSQPQDLVEIQNRLTQWVNLKGWHLSDRENNLQKWQFPSGEIPPNGFFLVMADGTGVVPQGSTNLHANFSLDSGGEWVGLTAPGGALASALRAPEFLPNVAYGVGDDGRVGYLKAPTPGTANGPVTEFGANDVIFSKPHGYYEQGFALELSATVPGSTIRYSIDGSLPTATSGLVYSAPISITPNTTATTRGVRIVRALAVNPKAAYARGKTQTYLFVNGLTAPLTDGIVSQSRLVTSIRNHAVYGPLLDDALRSLPALSVMLPSTPNAIEQPASIELFDPENAEEGFQINCGINVTGTSSLASPKLSMAAKFRAKYGRSKLRYPVFARGSMVPDRAATEFKELRLRSHSHDTFYWLGTRENPPVPYGSPPVTRSGDAQLARNIWIDEMQLLMGQPGKHGRQVHLYLNGAYHGIYHIHEHPDEDFMASYYPGSSEDFHFTGAATSGSEHAVGDTWRTPWTALKASLANYREAQRWVDVTNLCDYMVLSFYAGNDWDWSSQHNWSAAGSSARDRGGWKFFQQDSDVSLQDVNADCTDQDVPDGIFTALMRHSDFRVLFRDRVQKHCFNGGILSRSGEVYNRVMNEISTAIIAETARWQPGRSVAALPWDRDQEWTNEWKYLRDTFFPQRSQRLVTQLKRHSGWWPTDPPVFSQYRGTIPAGYSLVITSAVGTVYYTLDGSDPRLPGGSISLSARRANAGAVQTTIIPAGAVWKFLDNGTEPPAAWINGLFDDAAWRSGPTEIGYGDGGEATLANFVDTDPATAGVQKNITTYFRKAFDLPGFAGIQSVILRLTRDDGAVIYLNGREIYRNNMPAGPITSRTAASVGVSGTDESTPIEFTLKPADLALQPADNILAVEMHQQTPDSSDMSFNLELLVTGAGTNSPPSINVPTVVRARVFSGTDWSALTEAYLVPDNVPPASAENVVISEIQYHPIDENENEFLEFLNTSTRSVDLSDVTIGGAIAFRFPKATVLAPGERMVVAKDLALFQARYGTNASPYYRDVRVTGSWDGSLSNGGEGIILSGPDGAILFTCVYGASGAWPGRADGKGSSLELINPARVPLSAAAKSAWLSDPLNWRPSVEFHGSPGAAGTGPDNRIVINEFLAAPIAPLTDTIELKNTSPREIDLSGWFLSDSSGNYRKYRFLDGTKIAAGAYLVLQEESFNNTNNPACLLPFGLENGGEDIYLVEAQTNGAIMRFVDRVEYGAAPAGTIFGRWPDGTGPLRWLTSATFGGTNALPITGYTAWASVAFEPGTPADSMGPSADPDGDGLSNLAEYAFALSPLRRNVSPLQLVNWQGSNAFAFTFRKRTSAPDLKYNVEVSANLSSWEKSENELELLAETAQPDGSTAIVARLRPDENLNSFRFIRIVVDPEAQ